MFNCLNPTVSKKHRAKGLLAVAIGTALIVAAAVPVVGRAAEGDGQLLELKTERVIVFKDGYCLIVKRGTAVTDAQGEIHTEQVPDAAVLGSFWAVPKQGRLLSMRAGWKESTETTDKPVRCVQHVEVLQANLGKACKVELSEKGTFSGTIREVLFEESAQAVPVGLRSLFGLPEAPRDSETISQIAGSYFVLRTDDGDVLLPIAQIRTLSIHDMKTAVQRTVTAKKRTKQLTFRFEKPDQRRELLVMYFRPGLRWIPTYRVELVEDEEKKVADMALQAEILNEAEDLEGVPFDIVVGVPNFRFRAVPSPLVLESTLRNTLQQSAPNLMNQFDNNAFSNAIFTQRVAPTQPQVAQGEATIQLPSELTAAGTQDLFVYHLPKLDFKKGERTAVQIFTAEVPYRDVYTWDVHCTRRDIEAAPSGAGLNSPLALSRNEVWHQVELTNKTQVPWTTGAAIIMQGGQPLGQELLTYTSSGAAVRVPVTVSVDTRGSFSEEETARQLQALTWERQVYAKISKKATLRLHNHKTIPVEAEITFRVGGKFEEVSDDGKGTLNAFNSADWQDYRGSQAVNNSSTVRWNTTIQPGKTFQPTVTYHYYSRH
ncbi:MAG: hypothetical protein JXB62_15905 [Pirellulales bacterium]|nr:hypothetical protein [Pirellulales bacterium]